MSARSYQYTAIDATGRNRSGAVMAADEHDAFRKVAGAGLTPVRVRAAKERWAGLSAHRVDAASITGFTRELAVLFETRIPLDRGLISIAENESNPAFTLMIRDIASMVEGGQPFTAALEKYRGTFGEVYIETVRAGERSGNLHAVMTHLADLLERQMETRQQIRRAMAYPAIVMTMVLAAVTVIVAFVVPKFAATFASQGAELPMATRIIQAIGFSVRERWYIYLGAVVGMVGTVVVAWSRPGGRRAIETALLGVPYVRRIILAMTTGGFARVLSIALTSGLDLVEAVQIGGRASGRPVFADECAEMGQKLQRGEQFIDVLRSSRYLPGFARRMLGAGKDSAEVARACAIVARHYDRETSDLTKNINTIIEPLLTVAMAGIVLLVALAVFLPMWKMAGLHR